MSKYGLNKRKIQSIFEQKSTIIEIQPIKLFFQKNTDSFAFAITVSKNLKNKMEKKKIKRQIRSIIYRDPESWGTGCLIFLISVKYFDFTFVEIQLKLKKIQKILLNKIKNLDINKNL